MIREIAFIIPTATIVVACIRAEIVYHLTKIEYGVDQPEEVCIKVFASRRDGNAPHTRGGSPISTNIIF